jgi:hypothetical protein
MVVEGRELDESELARAPAREGPDDETVEEAKDAARAARPGSDAAHDVLSFLTLRLFC